MINILLVFDGTNELEEMRDLWKARMGRLLMSSSWPWAKQLAGCALGEICKNIVHHAEGRGKIILVVDEEGRRAFFSARNTDISESRTVEQLILPSEWVQKTDKNAHLGLPLITEAFSAEVMRGMSVRFKVYPKMNFCIRLFVKW